MGQGQNEPGQMEWGDALAAVRRSWLFVLVVAVAVGAAAVMASMQVPTVERVTGRLIVSPSTAIDADFSISDTVRVLTQPGVMGTLTEILENQASLEQAAEAAEAEIPPAALGEYEVTAQEVAGSLVVEVHVDGPDPAIADALANGVITRSTELFDELYPVYEVRVLDPVRPHAEPIQPSRVQFAALGAMVGAAGAMLLAIGWSRLRAPRSGRSGRARRRRRPRSEATPGSRPAYSGDPEAVGTGDGPTAGWPPMPPPPEPPESSVRTIDRS